VEELGRHGSTVGELGSTTGELGATIIRCCSTTVYHPCEASGRVCLCRLGKGALRGEGARGWGGEQKPPPRGEGRGCHRER